MLLQPRSHKATKKKKKKRKEITHLKLAWIIFCFPRISYRNYNLLKEMTHHEGKSADKQTEGLAYHEYDKKKPKEIIRLKLLSKRKTKNNERTKTTKAGIQT